MAYLNRIPNKVSFTEQEEKTLSFWKKNKIFEKSLENRKGKGTYVFYDGPPFATGLPHYGHLLAGIVKDIVPRYFAMQGNYVERRFGWDCHGLPVEMEMQKNLDLKTSRDIKDYGIQKFNDACKSIVLRYTEQWKTTVERIGRWVDFENDYKTLDKDFMESIWWVFKEIYDKGLIYKGFKVVPYSWKATTILSNFEANLNYQTTQDPSIIVRFPLLETPDESFLAWTTTPWTLISNLALCVNPSFTYVKIRWEDHTYILAKACVENVFKDKPITVLEELQGKELVGTRYKPLFDYAKDALKDTPEVKNAFQVLGDEFVGAEEGVGIVHLAPAYGEEDFRVCKLHDLPHYDPIDADGFFEASIAVAPEQNFKVADSAIIKALKTQNKIHDHSTLEHSYPFCWRTDTPLMYKAISTWFVKVESIKDDLIANNETIHWVPHHIKHGRFGEWLREAKDWAISRNRYWGTPIPIWEADDGERLCFGDIASLEAATGTTIPDLHKPKIDDLTIEHNGKTFKRVEEVLDCWFESGSMPYAHKHYPFQDKETFHSEFPADFISEGLDQTRGWFYTLLVIATCLFKKSSFKNVVVSGLILAEDGKKMSKRLKNYPDPNEVLSKLGADALRAYLISSQVLKGETLRFSEQGIVLIQRTIMIPLWNALSFLSTYANMDEWTPPSDRSWLNPDPTALTHPLDRWILSYRETLLKKINAAMQRYELYKAVEPLIEFIDKLTNIYIRRSRERFWKSQNDADKDSAYRTLYSSLKHFSIILAPFMPFLAEEIYQTLKNKADCESVHLENYPTSHEKAIDPTLEEELTTVNTLIALGRAARIEAKRRIRQPLSTLTIISKDPSLPAFLKKYDKMIRDELNVKTLALTPDESQYVSYSAKANFKELGKQYSHKMKAINEKLMQLSDEAIKKCLDAGKFEIILADETLTLEPHSVVIRRHKKSDLQIHTQGNLSCILHHELTPELEAEGLAREFIHCIQQLRKKQDLEYNDTIKITAQPLDSASPLVAALKQHLSTIREQTLTDEMNLITTPPLHALPELTEFEILSHKVRLSIEKILTT